MPINGTQYNDNNTVNGDGQFHKSLVGTDPQGQQTPNGPVFTLGSDEIHGLGGDDIIYGRGGSDRLFGENGNDDIYGDDGNSSNTTNIFPFNDDTLYGGIGDDNLHGESGNDILYGGFNEDNLYGGSGNDKLFGQWGSDYLFGGSGNDILAGGFGNDYLDGANFSGAGNGIGSSTEFDTLTGGSQADNFVLGNINNVYYLGDGHATITDFSLAQGDIIQIKGDFGDGYALGLGDWGGNLMPDTGIFFNNNLIGVVQDQNITNLNLDQVFISAPPIPQ